MPLAQIIITMDSAGVLRCEAPGMNGMRKKIDLPVDWGFLNPMLRAELKAQLVAHKQTQQAPSVVREDPQVLREKRITEARDAHKRNWTNQFNNATDVEREIMLYRREQAELKSQAREHERAKRVWEQTMRDHGIDLANRVITDPTRRPRGANKPNNKINSKPRSDPRLAINITL